MREAFSSIYRHAVPYIGRASRILGLARATIFCLHSVEKHDDPGRLLGAMGISDVFLDRFLRHLKYRGIDVVSLDECLARLSSRDLSPFVCITFDDGYRDNYEVAYPILRHHCAPAAIFLATGLLDRTSPMWWHPLERAISTSASFGLGQDRRALATDADRWQVYTHWADRFRGANSEEKDQLIDDLAKSNPNFLPSDAFETALEWGMVKEMAGSGLITFGAHTATHPVMAQLTLAELVEEVVTSRDRCADMIGQDTEYFAYPFWQAHETGRLAPRIVEQAGFRAAFTTRAVTMKASTSQNRFQLPRIMVSRRTQSIEAIDAYLSGLTEIIKWA